MGFDQQLRIGESLANNRGVVPFVADDDVGEGANADVATVRASALFPGSGGKVLEEIEVRLPDGFELGGQVS